MLLDYELKIDVATKASKVIMKRIIGSRSYAELKAYLELIDLEELVPTIDNFEPNGDVYILGDLKIRDNDISGIFKELSIDAERVKIIKGYDELKNQNFNKFQYDSSIRLILVGPMPHSMKGKGRYSSMITRMETEDGFPRVVRLGTEGTLRVTKSNLKKALSKEIQEGNLDINEL